MNLEKYLVISGLPGVHKLVSTRNNGLIIEDQVENRTRFVAVRQNQISPLATIGMYVEGDQDTLPLADIFQKMLDQYESVPPVSPDAKSDELRAYFLAVVPEHDQDRVHINDIKKCVKWFTFMKTKGIFDELQRESAAEASAAEASPVAETAAEGEETTNTDNP